MTSQAKPRRARSAGSSFHQIGNPFVRLILRSPFHRMMSGAMMLVTVTGKKTGREYTFPVQYASDGRCLYVIPGNHQSKTWWRNLIGGAPVSLRLRGGDVRGSAVVLNGGGSAAEVEEGLRAYLARFPAAARTFGVERSSDGALVEDGLRTAVEAAVLVRITPTGVGPSIATDDDR
jgi:hypothetical protein